jgi:hypothetical protein
MSHHQIDCVVDTNPMANSIDTVSRHVDATTTAVVAFQTAVIKAEKDGAEHVCKNVNKGFFTLMHSQLSQKIATNQSRVDSLTMELVAQKKRLLAIKSTMEKDYSRIVSRYSRIITGINKTLKQRVVELDRPVFEFTNREIACNMSRNQLLAAVVPVCQLENLTASQQITASNMKHDSFKVIDSTEQFLRQMNEQKILTDKILLRSIPGDEGTEHYPVAILESQIDSNGNLAYGVTVPEGMDDANMREITGRVYEKTSDLEWKEAEINDLVKQEFAKLVVESNASDRVKQMANKLFESRKMQTL